MYISEIVLEEIKTLQGVEEIVHCTLESIKLMLLTELTETKEAL